MPSRSPVGPYFKMAWGNLGQIFGCCRLNVCVLPKLISNPNLHCDRTRRWGLWEVIRSWRWGPHDGIVGIIKETQRASSPILASEDTEDGCPRSRKQVLPRHRICWLLDLGLAASRTVRDIFLLFESPQSVVVCYSSRHGLRHRGPQPWLHIEIKQGAFKSADVQAPSQTNLIRFVAGGEWDPGTRILEACGSSLPAFSGTWAPLMLQSGDQSWVLAVQKSKALFCHCSLKSDFPLE